MTVKELAAKIATIDLERMKVLAVEANEAAIVDMNRQQMVKGSRADGEVIEPEYRSFSYAMMKKDRGGQAPLFIPDLKLTGDFHEAMAMAVDEDGYEIGSSDEKTGMLMEKYRDIFGLTEENKVKARALTTVSLSKLYKQATGLK